MAGIVVCDVCHAEGELVVARMGHVETEHGMVRLDVTHKKMDSTHLCDKHTLVVLSAFADKLTEAEEARHAEDPV